MNSIQLNTSLLSCSSQNTLSKPTDQSPSNEKVKRSKKSTRKTQGKREGGRWNKIQLFKYFLFLSHHQRRFEEDEIRRSLRMFKHMSMFIKTRKPSQCRVKHMKNMRKFGSVKCSIQNFVEKNPNFYEKYEKVKVFLQLLDDQAYFGEFQGYVPTVKPTLAPQPQKIVKKQQVNSLAKQEKVKIQDFDHISPPTQIFTQPKSTMNSSVPLNMYWHPYYAFHPMFLYM